MIALALVLGLLKVFELPQGGSISLEMLPCCSSACAGAWEAASSPALPSAYSRYSSRAR
ncbi:energy-coupled thiamine transporter ThiT [Flavonifractor plautii]|nr:energy-coupled thiamine transporter ThiT [Flavonifractor plautii]